jgi:carbon-monoxide dehydrogenase small subunit
MSGRVEITLTVNGETVRRTIEPRLNLVDFVREELGLTGAHAGCEQGACGACSLRVDGKVVRGCLMFAVQVDGADVETIEGLAQSGRADDLMAAFKRHNSLQCGFCTPGMLLTADELLSTADHSSRAEIRDFISGNYCRCTGYQAIVDAIEDVQAKRGG